MDVVERCRILIVEVNRLGRNMSRFHSCLLWLFILFVIFVGLIFYYMKGYDVNDKNKTYEYQKKTETYEDVPIGNNVERVERIGE